MIKAQKCLWALLILMAQIPFIFSQQEGKFFTRYDILPALYQNIECPVKDDWALIFEDNFDQGSADTSFTFIWKPNLQGTGHLKGNDETIEYYSKSNLVFQPNGWLCLKAEKRDIYARGTPWSPDNQQFKDGGNNLRTWKYKSGAITSWQRFNKGCFELRCKIPKNYGFWPAFWLYDGCGEEVDIFEFPTPYKTIGNKVKTKDLNKNDQTNYHWLGNCHNDKSGKEDGFKYIGPNFADSPHIFTFVWDDFKMEWYVDGSLIRKYYHYRFLNVSTQQYNYLEDCEELKRTILETGFYERTTGYPVKKLEIIINNAVESDKKNKLLPNNLPQALEMDYMRVFKPRECQSTLHLSSQNQISGSSPLHEYGPTCHVAGRIILHDMNGPGLYLHPTLQFNDPGAQLTLVAEEEIVFRPNFTASKSSRLIAKLQPCGGQKQSHLPTGPTLEPLKNNLQPEEWVVVFPNPSNGAFSLRFAPKLQNPLVRIIDINGSVVFSKTEKKSSDWDDFEYFLNKSGLYFIVVKENDFYWSGKLIIQP